MSGALQAVFMNQRSFGPPPGQQAYTTTGTYSWVAPAGVTSVSVVVVGSGGYGSSIRCQGCCGKDTGAGGGGGALTYGNNITVIPGNSYTVQVKPNITNCVFSSFFVSAAYLNAGNGQGSNFTPTTVGGNGGTSSGSARTGGFSGGKGGNGIAGAGSYTGGGSGAGAGGYAGAGAAGVGRGSVGIAGTGGSGGSGGGTQTANAIGAGGGGGVGLLGQGTSGTGGTYHAGGGGGSSGSSGGTTGSGSGGAGGAYGGGGGGARACFTSSSYGIGAVRIIWPGSTRTFPSTCTGDK